MAFAETAPLIAILKLDDKFSGPLKNAQRSLSQFDAKLSQTSTRGYRAGQQIGTGIKNGLKIAAGAVALLATQVVLGLNSLIKLEQAQAQTNAVLRSTKGAAGVAGTEVTRLAEKYEGLNAIIGDEFIRAGENMLLTFTRIRGQAFEPALQAVLDLNVALGRSPEGLTTTAVLVGKALNDPVKGLTALQRVGVSFTAAQKKQIEAFLKTGDILGAQKVILKELNTEFAGSFLGQGQTTAGEVAKFTDAIEDLQRVLAVGLLPVVGRVADILQAKLADPKVVHAVGDLGTKIANLFNPSNLAAAGSAFESLFTIVKSTAPLLEQAAGGMVKIVKAGVDAFKSLPPEIQKLAIAGFAVNKLTGGLVTNIAGGLISAVISSFKGMMNVNAAVVNVNGGVAGSVPGAAAAGGAGVLATLAAPLAAAVAVGVTAKLQQDNVDQQASDLKLRTLAFAKTASDAQLAASIDGVRKTLAGLGEGPLSNPFNVKGQTVEVLNLLITELNKRTLGGNVLNAQGGVANRQYGPYTQAGINAQGGMNGGYGPWTNMTDALKSNTSAIKRSTTAWSEVKGEINADRAARGLTGPFKRSTSLVPRFTFLRKAESGAKDVNVADAIATGFERAATPLFRNTKLIPKSIKELERDQHQLLKAGDTKNAALIGKDIERLKAEEARRLGKVERNTLAQKLAAQATTQAVKDKDQTVTVKTNVASNTYINGRNLSANLGRYIQTYSSSLRRDE